MKHKMREVVSVFVLALCMLIVMLPVPFLAEPVGTEIPEDAIYISTTEDLFALAENCRVNTWSVGKTVVLSNDIDVSEVDFEGIPTFGGTFLGQGYSITGLSINGEGSVVGFFRYLQKNALVENLTISGSIHPAGSKSVVGGFVGENAGTIRNCTFKGSVMGNTQIGGLVGINTTSGIIDGCNISGTISGNHFVGGAVGENKGVVRATINSADINTSSLQNSVNLEDITMDSLTSTESANTATDIGGIVGANGGVVRACINYGAVGYQKMGYNIGGIAGSQTGYMVDCINYADIEGRKEVGGIVGHMEPNLSLDYDSDSVQILAGQLDALSAMLKDMQATLENSTDTLNKEMESLEDNIDEIQEAMDIISTEMEKDNPDYGAITSAMSKLSDSLSEAMDEVAVISETATDMMSEISEQLDGIITELDVIIESMETIDDNLGFNLSDVSGEDTDSDTLGKVENCWNYGDVTGDQNIGGIAGIMAEETDLEAYEDVEVSGDISLNGTYQARVVIRYCRNFGTVTANKQYAGGITGQMMMGAVLDSINVGNLDCINADYVGGIAGDSNAIIRNSTSKSIISGDTYVGGIAGNGNEVKDCYAFVSIVAHTEKAGAILGYTDDMPKENDKDIAGNYFFVSGNSVGGIDGIIYEGSTDQVDLEGFLALPNLDEVFSIVTITFVVEGQDDIVCTMKVGETLKMSDVPVLTVEADSEYSWEVVPAVTEKVLGMNETATVDYISDEAITEILFNQVYKASFDLKNTIVSSEDKTDKGLAILLANGVFAKNTTIEIKDILASDGDINGKAALASWSVTVSNTGVEKLHYYIPENINIDAVKLYVKNADGEWVQREFVVDLSYAVFSFNDGETAFAFVADYSGMITTAIIVVVVLVAGVVVFAIRKKKSTAKAV